MFLSPVCSRLKANITKGSGSMLSRRRYEITDSCWLRKNLLIIVLVLYRRKWPELLSRNDIEEVMTTYVLGVGVGLFLIISLWTVAIALCIISLRTQKNLGLIVIVVAAVVTLILVLIPRESENPAPPVFKLYDHFFIWRTLIVIFLGLSALAGFVVVLITHFMEPRLAQPIKEWKL